ncbi:hypothetical protein HN51_046068, partial [Arachis hypogaea]
KRVQGHGTVTTIKRRREHRDSRVLDLAFGHRVSSKGEREEGVMKRRRFRTAATSFSNIPPISSLYTVIVTVDAATFELDADLLSSPLSDAVVLSTLYSFSNFLLFLRAPPLFYPLAASAAACKLCCQHYNERLLPSKN